MIVRARLGEPAAEDAFFAADRGAGSAKEKIVLSRRVGYAATDRTVALLAEEIRSPDYYVWNQRSRKSLRVHIIDGLQVWPRIGTIFIPFRDNRHPATNPRC